MSLIDDLLREDDELQKLLRLRRAIDKKLTKLGAGKKRGRKRAGKKDGEVEDFFDVTEGEHDTAFVHDEE